MYHTSGYGKHVVCGAKIRHIKQNEDLYIFLVSLSVLTNFGKGVFLVESLAIPKWLNLQSPQYALC
jgi:hypothetical protein